MSDAVWLAVIAVVSSLGGALGVKYLDGWLSRGRNVHEDEVNEKTVLRQRVEKLEATCDALRVGHANDLERVRTEHLIQLGALRDELWASKLARTESQAEIHTLTADLHRIKSEIEEAGVERHNYANRVTAAELKLQKIERIALKNGWDLGLEEKPS